MRARLAWRGMRAGAMMQGVTMEWAGVILYPPVWAVVVLTIGAVLLLGFADLIRGGITLGPVLLTIGYCVLVPVAILRR